MPDAAILEPNACRSLARAGSLQLYMLTRTQTCRTLLELTAKCKPQICCPRAVMLLNGT